MTTSYRLQPKYDTVDFNEIDDASDLVTALNFNQAPMELPEDPTPEQFEKAEPAIIQMAIEQQIDPYAFEARERGENIGNIIDPIDMKFVKRVKPGHYQGAFMHDRQAYKFSIKPKGGEFQVTYSPVNKK